VRRATNPHKWHRHSLGAEGRGFESLRPDHPINNLSHTVLVDFHHELRVDLTKRVQTESGPRYRPAVVSANGHVKPEWVVDGAEERHRERSYYHEWRETDTGETGKAAYCVA
jgi:hypothetical protein